MHARDIFWSYFQQTGAIGSYLLTKKLEGAVDMMDDYADDGELE